MTELNVLFKCFLLITLLNVLIDGNSTLQSIHVIFRHGYRTLSRKQPFPKDPYINLTYYPYGYGQLTNEGKRMMYELGETLRRRYDDFLGIYYVNDEVEARSDHYPRNQASLLTVLASLYPPKSVELWNRDLNWQPIPITYIPRNRDKEFRGFKCVEAVALKTAYTSTKEYKESFANYKELAEYVEEHTGWNVTTMETFYHVYALFQAEYEMGLKLPKWSETIYPLPLKKLAINYYLDYTSSDVLKRYTAGFMIKKVIDDAKAKILNKNRIKIHLLSGHKFNLAFLTIFLNLFDNEIPFYATQLIMELHKIDGVYGFMVYKQDFSHQEPRLLKLPNCDYFCTLEKFEKLYGNLLPDETTTCTTIIK